MDKPFEFNVSSPYGAPVGRRSDPLSGKVRLQRVPFQYGDYDPGGAYWGGGTPLYCAWNDDGAAYVRAASRQDAKRQFQTTFPNCTFYR